MASRRPQALVSKIRRRSLMTSRKPRRIRNGTSTTTIRTEVFGAGQYRFTCTLNGFIRVRAKVMDLVPGRSAKEQLQAVLPEGHIVERISTITPLTRPKSATPSF